MSVEEIERVIVRENEPKKKVAEPPKFQAVYRQSIHFVCGCNVKLLSEIFKISANDATNHILTAIFRGQDTVLVGSRDMIETKVQQGNNAAQDPKRCDMLSSVSFTCEQL